MVTLVSGRMKKMTGKERVRIRANAAIPHFPVNIEYYSGGFWKLICKWPKTSIQTVFQRIFWKAQVYKWNFGFSITSSHSVVKLKKYFVICIYGKVYLYLAYLFLLCIAAKFLLWFRKKIPHHFKYQVNTLL